MGLGRRIFDLARANLNAVLDQAGSIAEESAPVEALRARQATEREAAELARRAAEARGRLRAAAVAGPPPAAPRPGGAPADTHDRVGPPPGDAVPKRPSTATGAASGRLRELYALLEVPYGAPLDEVRRGFRRLMRRYHPDVHVSDPARHAAATRLTAALTEAYAELERHLEA